MTNETIYLQMKKEHEENEWYYHLRNYKNF